MRFTNWLANVDRIHDEMRSIMGQVGFRERSRVFCVCSGKSGVRYPNTDEGREQY